MANSPTRSIDDSSLSADHIESEETFDQLLASEDRVLVDFSADWCGPCQLMVPMVDDLAAESEVPVVKVDVETLPEIADRYDVSSIPTFLAFEHGAVEERLVGMQEIGTLAQMVE